MAKNRYVGDYPVIGIRPIVDGRRGPMMLRESLEPIVWAMANAAKKLFEEKDTRLLFFCVEVTTQCFFA